MFKKIICRLVVLLGIISTTVYSYPTETIELPNHSSLQVVGTIHMGKADYTPLPAALIESLRRSDALIVEMDPQRAKNIPIYNEIPPLKSILSEEQYDAFNQYSNEVGLTIDIMDTLPAWQSAMFLQIMQAKHHGFKAQFGIDNLLIEAAKEMGKPIIELEGFDTQLALLEKLPNNGLALLIDTLNAWNENPRLLNRIGAWWKNKSPQPYRSLILPPYYNASYKPLLSERNQVWNAQLRSLPQGNYMVAIGVLHLFGQDNLLEYLKRSE